VQDEVTVVVQVNGKLRAKLTVAKTMSEEDVKRLALADENVRKYTETAEPKKIVYVPGRLVNIVL
jgi:leucyl-tRNA synthetase